MKRNLLKLALCAMAALPLGAWGEETTRTWNFTDNTKWSTIAASSGTVYYATDGSESNSTAFNSSTAICMNVTNAFTYSTDHYAFGGNSTTISENVPNKDYMSIVIPAGYTLTVNGAAGAGLNYSNSANIMVGGVIKVGYKSTTYSDLVYSNNSASPVTAYIYTPSTNTARYINIKSITLTSGTETLTAISGNCSWNFTNRPYDAIYDGATYDNIYFSNGVQQKVVNLSEGTFRLVYGGTGDVSTGANTVQIKVPANQAVGLLVNMGGSNGRTSKISDGTNELLTIDASNATKDTPLSIASSASERTLYFYNTNYDAGYGYINYIYVYTKQSVNIGSSGWATLYTPCALDFSGVSGLTAYTASCDGSTVTLNEVSNVQAGTGVVLKGTPNTPYDIPVTSSSTGKGDLLGAYLTATAYNAFDGYDLYMLALNGEGKVQFTKATSGEIAAGKAFLKLTSAPGARSLKAVFDDDETTGITSVSGTKASANDLYFDLQGRRVAQPTKGLYIVNGKKIIVK